LFLTARRAFRRVSWYSRALFRSFPRSNGADSACHGNWSTDIQRFFFLLAFMYFYFIFLLSFNLSFLKKKKKKKD
jgi:hypothetical protein